MVTSLTSHKGVDTPTAEDPVANRATFQGHENAINVLQLHVAERSARRTRTAPTAH